MPARTKNPMIDNLLGSAPESAGSWSAYADQVRRTAISHLARLGGSIDRIQRQLAAGSDSIAVTDAPPAPGIVKDFPADGVDRLLLNRAANQFSQAIGASSSSVLPANSSRLGVSIVNIGGSGTTIGLGDSVTNGAGIWLSPNGGSWDGLIGNVLWVGALSAVCDGGTTLAIVEV